MNIPIKDKVIINLALAGLLLAIALLYVVVKTYEVGRKVKLHLL